MKDEATDIIILIILIGATIAIAFNTLVPTYRAARELQYDVVYDKSVKSLNGAYYGEDMNIDEGKTYEEMILTLGTQSYFMPTPRVLDICGNGYSIQSQAKAAGNTSLDKYADVGQAVEEITDDYIPNTETTLDDVKQALYTWGVNFRDKEDSSKIGIGYATKLKYSLRFTVGDSEELTDDCYSVYILAKDSIGKTHYFRCTAGGDYTVPSNILNYSLVYSS